MHAILNIAVKATQVASKTIIRSMERVDSVRTDLKKRSELVERVQEIATEEIFAIIHESYPETEGAEWLVESIDCIDNYARIIPHFATIIVYRQKEKTQHAMIYDLIKQELFVASRGKGAFVNNRRIRVTQTKELKDALIGTNAPDALMLADANKRCSGSLALDLAYVAAGRFDGFWGLNLAPIESMAGTFLIQEAGGLIADHTGNENFLVTGNVAAANPKLFKAMLQTN